MSALSNTQPVRANYPVRTGSTVQQQVDPGQNVSFDLLPVSPPLGISPLPVLTTTDTLTVPIAPPALPPVDELPTEGPPMPPPPTPEPLPTIPFPDFGQAELQPPTVITETPTIESSPVVVNLAVSPRALNDQMINATAIVNALNATEDDTGLIVTVKLPEGADYVDGSARAGEYDPTTKTLTWRGLNASKQTTSTVDMFAFKAPATAAPTHLVLQATVMGGKLAKPFALETIISVGVERKAKPTPKDEVKELQVSERVKLEFAADEPAADQDITAIEYPAVPLNTKFDRGMWLEFGPEMSFKQPVTLTVNLDGLAAPELLDAGYEPMLIYWPLQPEKVEVPGPDGKPRVVEAIRSQRVQSYFDPGRKLLTARLAHFSIYEVVPGLKNVSAPQPWKLSANLGSVGLFRGSANFGYPINVPPMQDGLQPDVAFGYSSASADGYAKDDSNLGVGWSLDIPHIRQGIKFEAHHDSIPGTGATAIWYSVAVDNDYRLSLNGQEYNLIPKGIAAGAFGEYVPENYAPIRVFKCQTGQYCNGLGAVPWVNWGGEYWQVWTPDGVRTVFGGTDDSTRYYTAGGNWGWQGNSGAAIQTWYIRAVYAPGRDNGNDKWSAAYIYAQTQATGCGKDDHGQTDLTRCYTHDSKIRPAEIRYGNSRGANWPQYQISFAYSNPGDTGRLTNVWMNWHTSPDWSTGWNTMRYYSVGYDFYGQVNFLQEAGYNAVTGQWVGLPATTLEYGPPNTPNESVYHLKAVNNGYGGRTEFSYHVEPSYRLVKGFVQRDVNTSWVSFKTYSYSGACFNVASSICRTNHDWNEPNGALIGHTQVAEQQRAAWDWNSAVLQTVRHNYFVDTRKMGRETDTRVYDGGGNTLHAVHTDYYDSVSPSDGLPSGTWFAAPWKVRTYPLGDAGANAGFWAEVEHGYSNVLGNPLIRQETSTWTRTSSGSGQRSEFMDYAYNADTWIIKPAWQNIYDGIVASNDAGCADGLKQQVILYYDGNNSSYTATPSRGLVTRALTGSTCPGEVNASEYFGYDGAYAGGYVTSGAGNLSRVKDARGYETWAGFDASGLFMTNVSKPLGHTAYYHYFGVNATGDGGSGQYGQLQAIVDPNNAKTLFSYDAWGRLRKVAKPGDTLTHPTEEYFYYDTNTPSFVQRFVRKVAGAGVNPWNDGNGGWWTWSQGTDLNALAFWERSFYDGLGRVVETQRPMADWASGGSITIAWTNYDVFGRTWQHSVPYAEAYAGSLYRVPNAGAAKTTTAYDALNRVTSVTGPDGATTAHGYELDWGQQGATHWVLDANSHAKHQVSDVLGRLVRVREFTGTGPWPLYAETSYSYDSAGNLRFVADAHGNTTEMRYDALGRKTWMNDPDMGIWSYGYDANGNLTTQTDAKNQTLTFTYDALNRLTDKYVNGAWTSWYRYDEPTYTANALGRRTRMGGAYDETRWVYDARGRTTYEDKYITGAGWYATAYSYDSADRVTSMTYPTGEVVTTGYNAAGQANSLTGWHTYVAHASYNAFGQTSTINFGNGVNTTYYYHGDGNPWSAIKSFRLYRIVTTRGAVGLQDLYHYYDNVGNLTHLGSAVPCCEEISYSYDALDRLTSASGALNESYAYDPIGNLTHKNGVNLYYWDTAHKHAVTNLSSNGTAQMGWYDANGNMYRRVENGTTYEQTWDAENHLNRVTGSVGGRNADTQFFYGADGNLVKKVEGMSDKPFVVDGFELHNPQLWNATGSPNWSYNDGGELVLKATGTNAGWSPYVSRAGADMVSGRSVTLDFKLSQLDTEAHFTLESGVSGGSRWSLNNTGNMIQACWMQNAAWQGCTPLVSSPSANKWYRMRLTLDDANGFKAEVWERESGAAYTSFTRAMPAGGVWYFFHTLWRGTAYLDNYTQRFVGGSRWTVYIGPHAEWTNDTAVSYYLFNGQRVVRRDNWTLAWLHGDHLGSTSLVTDGSGNYIGETRYRPYGEKRAEWNAYFSDKKFTGQREEYALGSLYHYGARFYSPLLGRFISADSIIPRPDDPQSLNRFAYGRNNPLRYVDPTGHADIPWDKIGEAIERATEDIGDCFERGILSCMGAPPLALPSTYAMAAMTTNAVEEVGVTQAQGVVMAKGKKDDDKNKSGSQGGGGGAPGGGGNDPNRSKNKSNVSENKAKGDAFRDEVAGKFRKQGYDVQTEVTKQTPFGPRRIDVEVTKGGKTLGGVETKTGNSRYTASQRAKDNWLKRFADYVVNLVRRK